MKWLWNKIVGEKIEVVDEINVGQATIKLTTKDGKVYRIPIKGYWHVFWGDCTTHRYPTSVEVAFQEYVKRSAETGMYKIDNLTFINQDLVKDVSMIDKQDYNLVRKYHKRVRK